jgi:hypothetical protein
MALQLDLADPTGNTVTNAYCVVDLLTVNKRQQVASLVIECWRSQAARQAGKQPFMQFTYSVLPNQFATFFAAHLGSTGTNNPSPYTDAYAFVKSRPEFAGAADV